MINSSLLGFFGWFGGWSSSGSIGSGRRGGSIGRRGSCGCGCGRGRCGCRFRRSWSCCAFRGTGCLGGFGLELPSFHPFTDAFGLPAELNGKGVFGDREERRYLVLFLL